MKRIYNKIKEEEIPNFHYGFSPNPIFDEVRLQYQQQDTIYANMYQQHSYQSTSAGGEWLNATTTGSTEWNSF